MRKDKDGRNLLSFGYPVYESDTIDFLDAMRSFMVHDYVEVIESYGIKYENRLVYSYSCWGDFAKNESFVIDISSKDRSIYYIIVGFVLVGFSDFITYSCSNPVRN